MNGKIIGLVCAAVVAFGVPWRPAQAAVWTNTAKFGDWNVAGNWNPNDVPDTDTETVQWLNSLSSGPYTCRVDNVMYPAGLTCGGVRLDNQHANASILVAPVLSSAGLTMTVGSPANPTNILIDDTAIFFTNSSLTVHGDSGCAIEIFNRPIAWPWNAEFLNSSLLVPSGSTGLYLNCSGISGFRGGTRMRMTDGSLTVTNSTLNSILQVGNRTGAVSSTNIEQRTTLSLTRTKLTACVMNVWDGRFIFDGAGATGDSVISSNLSLGASGCKGGIAEFLSGNLTIGGNVTGNSHGSGLSGLRLSLMATGATVVVQGNVNWTDGGNNANNMRDPTYIDVYKGSLDVWGSLTFSTGYGTYPATEKSYLRIFGGSLGVSNSIAMGGGSYRCPAYLEMTGGSVVVSNLVVGRAAWNDGYYNQTGGTNTVRGTITLQATNAAGYASQQFVLGSNATLILKGNGFVKEGTTGWSTNLLTDANLGFRGRTVFDPAAGVAVQTNFAFGRDVGAVLEGLTNFASAGTWDFSAVGAGEKVKVVGAGNFSGAESNAVYVSSILGLPPAEATNRLQSAVNVYYDPRYSLDLGMQDLPLTGGGRLKVIRVKLAATLIWVM
jgi:hypothetical protein